MLLLAACTDNKTSDTLPEPLYPQPQTVPLTTNGGYKINTVTGDSIKPIITKTGDTLITGVPIPIQGKAIHPDSVAEPIVVQLTIPVSSINAHSNVHKIPDDLTIIAVNKDSLTTILLKEITKGDTSHYKLNKSGDTIQTGIPIPAIGKTVAINLPQPIKALPPAQMDAAITNLQYLDADQGMESSRSTSILEDKEGNLWFGIVGGVCRYDGKSFTHFTKHEGLNINTTYSILEDKEGNIWFGAYGVGSIRYDGGSFTYFTEQEGSAIYLEDKEGNLWLNTGGGGVSRYDGVSFTHFTEKEGLINNQVTCMTEDKGGNLWIGTVEGICRFDGKSFTYFTEKEGLSNNNVRSIIEDKVGNIWIGTYGGGVSRYDGHSFTHFTQNEGLSKNTVKSLVEDKVGNIWIGTEDGGVNRYDGSYFTHFTENEGLSSNAVSDIIEDKAGNLWITTSGGGVNHLVVESFTHFTEKRGLSKNDVWSMVEDRTGNIWFGTMGGGISRYDGRFFTNITQKEGLSSDWVVSLLEDKAGNIWMGMMFGGVDLFNGESITHFTEKGGLFNGVTDILEDKDGNIWFLSGSGLCMYNGEVFTHFSEDEGLFIKNTALSILEDKDGNIWVGTFGSGAIRYDGESITYFTEKEGLSNNMVTALIKDKDGNILVGTDGGGVSKFNGESFTHFTEKEGLSNNNVRSLKEDKVGTIWVGTQSGLASIIYSKSDAPDTKHDQIHEKVTINSLNKADGLKGMECMVNGVGLDSKNRMWWGAAQSLTMLDLNNASVSSLPPALFMRQVDIDEQYIDYRNITSRLNDEIEFSGVQRFANYPLNLELPHDKNHLTFHFNAIDWVAPHKIRYSYIINGLSTKWSKPTEEGKADYRNLPYGVYKFKVRAIGESGEWSEALEYEFTIHPPWWHTWWARTIYVLGALLILYLIFRWRIASLKARQKELEHEVDVATIEIRQQRDEIEKEKDRSEELLLNILPSEIAEELKEKGHADAQMIEHATVLFSDFKGFTAMAEKLSPEELVNDLNVCFSKFDEIMEKYGIEKIKTIGDAYMAAGGLPTPNETHATDVVEAAFEIRDFVESGKALKIEKGLPYFEIRIGVHTGPLVAGIVGIKKFQYDIWGDTVNTASRMESSGGVGQVNISQSTYELIKEDSQFSFENRGKIEAKGKGEIQMWFVSKA